MTDSAASRTAKLYTPEILSLATELAEFPLTSGFEKRASVRSRSCGSTLAMGLKLNDAGKIADIGLTVSACAIGQASAAIFASAAQGRSSADIAIIERSLNNWLTDSGALPEWPRIQQLAEARAYPGRHEAIMLPWRAAREALSKVSQSG